MPQTRKIELADPREGERDFPFEVLIGGDYYWKNNKGYFHNTPFLSTGFAPYEVRLDFDWK